MEEQKKIQSALITLVIITVFATGFYRVVEGWSWINALYFTVATATTVGYGDFVPTEDASKLFTVVYMITSIGLMLYVLNVIANRRIHFFNLKERFHIGKKKEE